MHVSEFDFTLPPERIADRPVYPRDASRLLLVNPMAKDKEGQLVDHAFADLPSLLQPGDILVANDTRVIPARLRGKRGEAGIEVTLHQQQGPTLWAAFVKPAKKAQIGDIIDFNGLKARVTELGERGERFLDFDVDPADMMPALVRHGDVPLPPYIEKKRRADDQDKKDYQTIFADKEGAVAAPTAGLHFTDDVLEALEKRGIDLVKVTLHVGAGTFLPVTADNTEDHKMHAEWGEIKPDVAEKLNQARKAGRRIISIGTTSLRLLESAADSNRVIHPFLGDTDIFITPGYRFNGIDGLITNFHLPKSTLFMLVSAFSGLEMMQRAYAHAIDKDYRFYSYGDSSLLLPKL